MNCKDILMSHTIFNPLGLNEMNLNCLYFVHGPSMK